MLGILKAGATYIPLDPEIPADRVNFIMEDAGAKLTITSNEILDRIGEQLSSFPIFNIDKQRADNILFGLSFLASFRKICCFLCE
jgi:non-ribosomal peptide synthetase component F